jgi:hypothetical protein
MKNQLDHQAETHQLQLQQLSENFDFERGEGSQRDALEVARLLEEVEMLQTMNTELQEDLASTRMQAKRTAEGWEAEMVAHEQQLEVRAVQMQQQVAEDQQVTERTLRAKLSLEKREASNVTSRLQAQVDHLMAEKMDLKRQFEMEKQTRVNSAVQAAVQLALHEARIKADRDKVGAVMRVEEAAKEQLDLEVRRGEEAKRDAVRRERSIAESEREAAVLLAREEAAQLERESAVKKLAAERADLQRGQNEAEERCRRLSAEAVERVEREKTSMLARVQDVASQERAAFVRKADEDRQTAVEQRQRVEKEASSRVADAVARVEEENRRAVERMVEGSRRERESMKRRAEEEKERVVKEAVEHALKKSVEEAREEGRQEAREEARRAEQALRNEHQAASIRGQAQLREAVDAAVEETKLAEARESKRAGEMAVDMAVAQTKDDARREREEALSRAEAEKRAAVDAVVEQYTEALRQAEGLRHIEKTGAVEETKLAEAREKKRAVEMAVERAVAQTKDDARREREEALSRADTEKRAAVDAVVEQYAKQAGSMQVQKTRVEKVPAAEAVSVQQTKQVPPRDAVGAVFNANADDDKVVQLQQAVALANKQLRDQRREYKQALMRAKEKQRRQQQGNSGGEVEGANMHGDEADPDLWPFLQKVGLGDESSGDGSGLGPCLPDHDSAGGRGVGGDAFLHSVMRRAAERSSTVGPRRVISMASSSARRSNAGSREGSVTGSAISPMSSSMASSSPGSSPFSLSQSSPSAQLSPSLPPPLPAPIVKDYATTYTPGMNGSALNGSTSLHASALTMSSPQQSPIYTHHSSYVPAHITRQSQHSQRHLSQPAAATSVTSATAATAATAAAARMVGAVSFDPGPRTTPAKLGSPPPTMLAGSGSDAGSSSSPSSASRAGGRERSASTVQRRQLLVAAESALSKVVAEQREGEWEREAATQRVEAAVVQAVDIAVSTPTAIRLYLPSPLTAFLFACRWTVYVMRWRTCVGLKKGLPPPMHSSCSALDNGRRTRYGKQLSPNQQRLQGSGGGGGSSGSSNLGAWQVQWHSWRLSSRQHKHLSTDSSPCTATCSSVRVELPRHTHLCARKKGLR